ncbi:type II secretion system protein F [Pseudomonas sp. J237]|nr:MULTISPECIES: type II secretion system F family protein [Pseudomonas]OEO23392.1 type II secretion system protein F [Pseudomonas sp. J237]
MAWLVMTVLLLMATALLVINLARERQIQHRVAKRLLGTQRFVQHHEPSRERWLQQFAGSRLGRRVFSLDGETQQLLSRIGWRRTRQRARFFALQLLSPLLMLALAALVQSLLSKPVEPVWVILLLAAGCGYLLPKRVLAVVAARRQKQLADEVSVFLPLLRILFDAGLTVEQALRVLGQESRALLPALTRELNGMLKRVDSGLDLASELQQLGGLLEVDEFSDCVTILCQLIRQGGGAMSSLLALKKVLDDRRLTRLQEYISTLSGKLSVVMMVFLFPALLIVLAGPGLSAIGRALGGIG